MHDRKYLSKAEKIEILNQVALHIAAGHSKHRAAWLVWGANGRNVFRWLDKDRDLWEIIHTEPYPYDDGPVNGRREKARPSFDWSEAMSKLVTGFTIRARGSRLYKYRFENGRLVEYRKSLTSDDWYSTTEVTIPEQAYDTWEFEVVA
jgi:hypothetical protein